MSRQTAQWYLKIVDVFLKDPKLSEWNYLPRDYFLAHLKEILKEIQEIETFVQAGEILQKIINEEIAAPSIPEKDNLEYWKQELEKAKVEKRKINEANIKQVRAQIKRWEEQRKVFIPLAKAVEEEAAKKAPKEEKIAPPPVETLPPEVAERLASEEEGVAFAPVYTVLQPKTLISFTKKIVLSPVVKPVQFLDKIAGDQLLVETAKRVPPERQADQIFREMLHQGLTAKDIEASIAALQETGLSLDHPKLVELTKKRKDFETFENSHRILAGILENYHDFSKIMGRRQVFLPEINIYLPRLSQLPVWSKKTGFSWTLRQSLNRTGTGLHFYQKIRIAPEKTVVHFSLPDTFSRILSFGKVKSFETVKSAVYQKTLKPVLVGLGKTAIGQGVKRAGAWFLTKLGLAALPEPVSKALLAASLVLDAAKFVWNKLKGQKKNIAIAIGAVLAAAGAFVISIGGISLGLGLLILGLGSLAAITFPGIISAASGALAGFASGTVSFFTALFTLPASTAPVTALVLGTLGGLSALTFFIVMTTSAAFILPISPTRYVSRFPPSTIAPTCPSLADMFNQTSQDNCIPPAILMAISQMEAAGVWGWSCEEIAFFSTPNWWENATEEQKNRGYCYDTCARTGLCSGTTVMGPMQFEEKTWQGIMPGYSLMDRCRLDLSLLAAAKKIKANSGTGPGECSGWGENIVRWKVAYHYCGSCGTEGCRENPNKSDPCSPACGYDYCGNVWLLYQQYANQ